MMDDDLSAAKLQWRVWCADPVVERSVRREDGQRKGVLTGAVGDVDSESVVGCL